MIHRRFGVAAAGIVLAAALVAGALAATAPPDRLPPTKPTIDPVFGIRSHPNE